MENGVSPGQYRFVPTSIEIDQGASVTWTNNTSVSHTVAISGQPTSPSLPNGGTFTHLFDAAGTFAFHCTLHLNMTGSVKVVRPTAHVTASKKMVLATIDFRPAELEDSPS